LGDIVRLHGRRQRRGSRRQGWPVSRRFRRVAVTLAVIAALGALSVAQTNRVPFASAPGSAQVLEGRASVVDGDTIEIRGQRVRFNGIDAPESNQQCDDTKGSRYRCGSKAAAALDEFLAASRPVRCEFSSWDRHGRFVGDCFRADGLNVAAWLVEQGQALDWPKYSNGRYASQQAEAKNARRGIWSGAFQEPWEWRAQHRPGRQLKTEQAPRLVNSPMLAQSWSCRHRRTCSQIGSCDEAVWYLNNCSWGGALDRDNDGAPCETLCGSNN
jgi:endonuclease YncB( thermonuclease family)